LSPWLRQRADLRRLLHRALVLRLALVALHRDRELRLRDRLLLARARLRLAELALLDGGLLLPPVRLDLLFGDLAVAKLLQDHLDVLVAAGRRRRADEDLLQLQVVHPELRLHLVAGDLLDVGALLDQLDQRARLADVLEYADTIGSSVCSTSRLMSPKR
jgi:hypothetical protein